jgi:lysyl-tRNA synthetase class 2
LKTGWRPGAGLAAMRARAAMLADLRRFFAAAGVLEVETPLLGSSAGTDPALQPLQSRYRGPGFPAGLPLFLQTSPEFAMKRLLASGSGPVYQICKAFRDGETGRMHNPEFTILEWYRTDTDLHGLILQTAELVRIALNSPALPVESHSYAQLFADRIGIDVFSAGVGELQDAAHRCGIVENDLLNLDRDGWLDLLLSHVIQPLLGRETLCCVTDYPASQAALARRNPDGRTAARFELFHQGIELANGFDELTDGAEQAARFEAENCARRAAGQKPIPVDARLLEALDHGLPNCVGVAVGLDRLLMLRCGATDIDQVLTFSLPRC